MKYKEFIKILDIKNIKYEKGRQVTSSMMDLFEVIDYIIFKINSDEYCVKTGINSDELDIVINKNRKNALISEVVNILKTGKVILNGKIWIDKEYSHLYIGNESVSSIDEFKGEFVKFTYYICKQPIYEDSVIYDFLESYYEGKCTSNSEYMYGTSWTGCYGREDEFNVGGHDIIEELSSHEGKYCYLILEYEYND